MTYWPEGSLRQDAFLGGAIHLWQPKKGYRAGIVSVLLAASVEGRAGQSVLDLGCGAGTAALCLGARIPGMQLAGLELQPQYADLARQNAAQVNAAMLVFEGSVADPPKDLKSRSFDHVIANPPYYDRGRGSAAPDPGRETALGMDVALKTWVKLAAKRLKPKGFMTVIAKADRLEDILPAAQQRLGSLEVLPLYSRAGQAADFVLLRARKDGRAPLIVHAPIILHEGASHPGDRDHYTPDISAVLRRGAALKF